MRKFNFNSFKKNQPSAIEEKQPTKPRFSAYRTILSRHDAVASRLKDEPVAIIQTD